MCVSLCVCWCSRLSVTASVRFCAFGFTTLHLLATCLGSTLHFSHRPSPLLLRGRHLVEILKRVSLEFRSGFWSLFVMFDRNLPRVDLKSTPDKVFGGRVLQAEIKVWSLGLFAFARRCFRSLSFSCRALGE